MLYDPKWNKEFSIAGLRDWLKTKDPEGRYNWQTTWCHCLIGEWRLAMGETADDHMRLISVATQLGRCPDHTKIVMIAANSPWTYGAALERAIKALEK